MAYTPTNWQIGDIITAEKLNKLENGVASGGGIFIVPVTATIPSDNPYSTEVAFVDVQNAAINGKVLIYSITTIISGEIRNIDSSFGEYDNNLQVVWFGEDRALKHSSDGITDGGGEQE